VRYAAFFRNLNLGRPKAPSRVQFEQAFLDAGAQEAASFLTNGTLVFSVGARRSPDRVLATASTRLHAVCGLVEPGFVRSVPYLADLVAADPFATVVDASVYAYCVTFLHPAAQVPATQSLCSRRGDVEVFRFTDTEALSLSRKIGNTPGSPNALLEKQLGLPATTRNWNTVRRLVLKHA